MLKAILGLVTFAIVLVIICTASGPLLSAMSPPVQQHLSQTHHTYHTSVDTILRPPLLIPPPPPSSYCGDGRCSPPETIDTCFADCPGITTPATCGEEPHSDVGGEAVAWGLTHKTATAAECCERCAAHAADPGHSKKPCNSWVFCPLPQCWSLDTGHQHTFGECWLKFQVDPRHPLYGQRGRYSEGFRAKHRYAHMSGVNADGTRRNLSVPSHVPWTGGVMGATVDVSVLWETGPDGMSSSKGDALVTWRAWESAEENRARGVPSHLLGDHTAPFGDPPTST